MAWNWKRTLVKPADILSAMETLRVGSSWHQTNLIEDWTGSDTYLAWAQDCLKLNTQFGFDAAVCYAKRAVCRQVDAFMVNNHLGYFLDRDNYPTKLATLSKVGLCVPDILHGLVIGPRNEIEHEYRLSTAHQANNAVQIAVLFLAATKEEAARKPIISYGWSINFSGSFMDTSEGVTEKVEYSLRLDSEPMLIVDVCDPNNHEVLLLRPKYSEMDVCPMKNFERPDAIAFAKKLRTQHRTENYSSSTEEIRWLRQLRQQLNFPVICTP